MDELDTFDFGAFEQWLKHWSGQKVSFHWFNDKMHQKYCDDDHCIHEDIAIVAKDIGLISTETEHIENKLIAHRSRYRSRIWVRIK